MHFFLLCLLVIDEPRTSRLAIIRNAPDLVLSTHTGSPLDLKNLNGSLKLVCFVFTTCNGSCPATTHRLVQVQDLLDAKAVPWRNEVQFVGVTLDPDRDTPERLGKYLKLYAADEARWAFCTGEPARVRKVIADWGMWVKPAPNGQLDHPSRVFLLDRRGRIREIYNLDYLRPAWVLEDLALLAGEKP